jgi:hypothetical protein
MVITETTRGGVVKRVGSGERDGSGNEGVFEGTGYWVLWTLASSRGLYIGPILPVVSSALYISLTQRRPRLISLLGSPFSFAHTSVMVIYDYNFVVPSPSQMFRL